MIKVKLESKGQSDLFNFSKIANFINYVLIKFVNNLYVCFLILIFFR